MLEIPAETRIVNVIVMRKGKSCSHTFILKYRLKNIYERNWRTEAQYDNTKTLGIK
jgi:hypothetical protein